MPVYAIPGLGGYRVQPVAVEDVAEIATWAAEQTHNLVVDAAGPDILTYGELVERIAIAVGRRPRFVYLSPRLTLWAGDLVAAYVHDVMLTRQELQGLMEELLVSSEKPRGARRIDNWLLSNSESLGRKYASELDRHWRGRDAPSTLPAASRPEAPPG
jgi:NADH dehydrogenase